ncbi:unnamed protein product [Notodromas monacha]|uniref:Transmembrane protein 209 n=1 Tax=Notodromas monacha TaxID=399045 RepID=A0A7R9BDI0_9CRUS|nr:unnamed protein product [Notodromas monacha]CAG0913327.1 unnamed protein product [Notodromas monacha]
MASFVHSNTVEQVVSRKFAVKESPKYLFWALIYLGAAAFFYVDLTKWNSCRCLFHDLESESWGSQGWRYTEYGLLAVMLLHCCLNTYKFIRPRLGYPALKLTEKQMNLLGIQKGEAGFDLLTPQAESPRQTQSPSKPRLISSSPNASVGSGSVTPMNLSAASWMSSASSGTRSSPWSSFSVSENRPSFYLSDSSPVAPSSPKSESAFVSPTTEFEERMKRERESMRKRDIFEPAEFISSGTELTKFLDKEPQWNTTAGFFSAARNSSESFMQKAADLQESTPPKRYTYQLAPTSSSTPGATGLGDEKTSSASSLHMVVFARRKLGISPEKLDIWSENLRKWISETVVRPVNKEIEAVNEHLQGLGSGDSVRIGAMSLNQIAAVSVSGIPGMPTGFMDYSQLHTLIPFLEAHHNQAYLILMHLFASYFDVHLPLVTFDSPRPFSFRHFIKKPVSGWPTTVLEGSFKVQTSVGSVVLPESLRDIPVICQAEISPPHFVFVFKGEVCEASKGRNNLLHTILLFLHHVKTQNKGMLGRVNLGLSGINVLWILE